MFESLRRILQRKLFLVYTLSPHRCSCQPGSSHSAEVQSTWADVETVRTIFGEDPRQEAFLRFLEKGFAGLFLLTDDTWAAYAWMSTPSTEGPPHLPVWVADLPVYWIFYCRTEKAFRGRGLYKLALQLLIEDVGERGNGESILIDTGPTNTPSRRAIASVGFLPTGAIVAWQLRVPHLGRWVWGTWRSDYLHPPLAKDAGSRLKE